MKKDLTVYQNDLNTIPFKNFTATEMDLFFSICSKMRNKGLTEINYSFSELREISNYKPTSIKRFVNDLDKTYSKLLALNYRIGNEEEFTRFVLFTGFEVNVKKKYVNISTNPKFEYILNSITSNFTKFELSEFIQLKSAYSKTAFRLLKQFRLTGYWKVRIDDFRSLLDIPDSYPMCKLTTAVLQPILKELEPLFLRLSIAKIKTKKGNKIEFLEFTFKPDDDFSNENVKVFRKEDGDYYENNFDNLTDVEENKAFPYLNKTLN